MATVISSGPIVVPTPYAACSKLSRRGASGQADRGVQAAVHHPGGHADQDGDGEDQPQSRGQREPRAAQGGADTGRRQESGHADALDQPAHERGDRDRAGRADQQDQAQGSDGSTEGLAHLGPGRPEHAIGQAQDREAAQGQRVKATPRQSR